MNSLYLLVDEIPVLALQHPPAGTPSGLGVLFCAPFGWDDVCSYRSRHVWAETLAAAGHAVLRFDYPGTGDSGDPPPEADPIAPWIAAATAGAARLRADGATRVVAVGLGIGGMVAWCAAADGAPIDDLVLWGTAARGRAAARELRALAQLEQPSFGGEPLPDEEPSVGGFALRPPFLDALGALDLRELPLPEPAGRRALLLERDGISVDADLERSLRDAGVDTTVADGPGWGALMTRPDHARLPEVTIDVVAAWLDVPHAESPLPAPETPARTEVAELGPLRETPFAVEHGGTALAGVLAEPADGSAGSLGVVFLNAGAIRRTGPGRLWVELARSWSRRGTVTLRLDVEGIGDAGGGGGDFSDVAQLYAPAFVAQARASIDALAARGVERLVLVGLCSGAYWAFQAALDEERVRAVLMLNPRVLVWDEQLEPAREARRARKHLFRPSSWWRIASGATRLDRRDVAAIAALATAPLRKAASRLTGGREPASAAEAAFARLDRRQVATLLVFADGEPLRDELVASGALERIGRRKTVTVESIPGRDHTLRPPSMQRRAIEIVDAAFERELERL